MILFVYFYSPRSLLLLIVFRSWIHLFERIFFLLNWCWRVPKAGKLQLRLILFDMFGNRGSMLSNNVNFLFIFSFYRQTWIRYVFLVWWLHIWALRKVSIPEAGFRAVVEVTWACCLFWFLIREANKLSHRSTAKMPISCDQYEFFYLLFACRFLTTIACNILFACYIWKIASC